MTIKPVSILGNNEEMVELLEEIYGKKPCVKTIYKLELPRTEKKQKYEYKYTRVVYLALVCPYLGVLKFSKTNEKPKLYCAGNHMDEDCTKLWKNGIPYVLQLIYEYERYDGKRSIWSKEEYVRTWW